MILLLDIVLLRLIENLLLLLELELSVPNCWRAIALITGLYSPIWTLDIRGWFWALVAVIFSNLDTSIFLSKLLASDSTSLDLISNSSIWKDSLMVFLLALIIVCIGYVDTRVAFLLIACYNFLLVADWKHSLMY